MVRDAMNHKGGHHMADITLGDPAPNFYLPSVDGSNFLLKHNGNTMKNRGISLFSFAGPGALCV